MQHNQAKFRIDTVVDAIFNAIFHLYTKNVVFFLHFNILMFEIFKKKTRDDSLENKRYLFLGW